MQNDIDDSTYFMSEISPEGLDATKDYTFKRDLLAYFKERDSLIRDFVIINSYYGLI
jgi:hypothetical protein